MLTQAPGSASGRSAAPSRAPTTPRRSRRPGVKSTSQMLFTNHDLHANVTPSTRRPQVDGVRLRLQGRLRPVGGESLEARRARSTSALTSELLPFPLLPTTTPLPTTTTHVHYRVRLTRGYLLALLPGLHLRAALARLVARVLLVDDVVAAAFVQILRGSEWQAPKGSKI